MKKITGDFSTNIEVCIEMNFLNKVVRLVKGNLSPVLASKRTDLKEEKSENSEDFFLFESLYPIRVIDTTFRVPDGSINELST